MGMNISMRVRAAAAAALPLALAAALTPAPGPARADEEKILNVYNWSDYIGETTVQDFEKETGIKVRYDTFDANETLYAKLVAGHTGYDIVVPSSHWAKLQLEGGLLKPLDKSKITTYSNIDPSKTMSGQMTMSIPGTILIICFSIRI